ncbi:GNAT family N-acetyltransferase [Pediococcus cellicola]|uniref:N-acetyltransferase domain-containing protein n=1 Tax=Pediococcus cellicola TaxID=319652 RepID=A0A0R2IRL3_9LACO|nr:GNAT family N-acetyltransferase [Pediococcus cellicola]KRN67707.1 hypothetical protein IV80_GL000250 [Pediococcus cellicola]GEL14303.1 putative N-acetyltransferase YvbK [Pediococcus cellicola]
MQIRTTQKIEQSDYNLLLMADPNKELVDNYLKQSFVFRLVVKKQLVGIMVLTPNDPRQIELKNIAIDPNFQHQGYAQKLIQFGSRFAVQQGYKRMIVGTGTTSFVQLYLYQKMGFRFLAVKKDFFIKNYPKPIIENGLHLKDMVVLCRTL